MLDAINDLTGTTTSFANLPAGTRAVGLPDNSYNKASQFLRIFGRPNSASVCECERIQSSSLAQSLHLINSSEIRGKVGAGNGRAAKLSKSETLPEDCVKELYKVAFSRSPTEAELKAAVAYVNEDVVDGDGKPISKAASRKQNMQDLVWALMNTKEFLFNH